MNDTVQTIASTIQKHSGKRVLLVTHYNPDGDAVGSAVALGYIAAHYGCDIRLYLPASLPDYLGWLDIPWPTVATLDSLTGWVPDLVIVSDCGDAMRAGPEIAPLFLRSPSVAPALAGWEGVESINIDHHEHNPHFATANLVHPNRAATTELVADVAAACGLPLSGGMGEAIYLGIVTDSGNFTYSNTSSTSHRIVADILDAGLDVARFTEQYENQWSVGRMNLWGRLMLEMQLHDNGRIASVVVTEEMHRQCQTAIDDLEGFASWMRRLKGVEIALFVRNDGNASKISLRSMGNFDVRAVAAHFGGGGHIAAAGAELPCTPLEARDRVLQEILARW